MRVGCDQWVNPEFVGELHLNVIVGSPEAFRLVGKPSQGRTGPGLRILSRVAWTSGRQRWARESAHHVAVTVDTRRARSRGRSDGLDVGFLPGRRPAIAWEWLSDLVVTTKPRRGGDAHSGPDTRRAGRTLAPRASRGDRSTASCRRPRTDPPRHRRRGTRLLRILCQVRRQDVQLRGRHKLRGEGEARDRYRLVRG
jgi:hypothetical protein